MNLEISEIQFACVMILTLSGIVYACVLPSFKGMNSFYNLSRIFILWMIAFSIIHYLSQYTLSKLGVYAPDTASLLNLLLGFPMLYLINSSLINLLYRGHITICVWVFSPVVYLIALALFFTLRVDLLIFGDIPLLIALPGMLFGACAVVYIILLIIGFVHYWSDKGHFIAPYKSNVILCFISLTGINIFSCFVPFVHFSRSNILLFLMGCLFLSFFFIYVASFVVIGLLYKRTAQAVRIDNQLLVSSTSDAPSIPQSECVETENGGNNIQETNAASSYVADVQTITTGGGHDNTAKILMNISAYERFMKKELYCKPGLTLKQAAEYLMVTPNMLKNWLRDSEYKKFNTWILYLRINKAKDLMMRYSELKNSEISERCGFCDRQYFQRKFLELVGMSPTHWLKEQQKFKTPPSGDVSQNLPSDQS